MVENQVVQQAQVVAEKAASRQNTIYLIWEVTQAIIAVALVMAAIYSSLTSEVIPDILSNALFIVMGFYFGRTNHARPTVAAKDPSL